MSSHERVGLLVVLVVVVLGLLPRPAMAVTAPIEVTAASKDAGLSAAGQAGGVCESTDAGGGCTLRAAVELADSRSIETGEELTVDVPTGVLIDTLGTLRITEGAQVTLAGSGASVSAIDGDEAGSVLTIEGDASLKVRDLTLRDGHGTDGGAIDVLKASTLIVERSSLVDNTATRNGGAISFEGAIPIVFFLRPAAGTLARTEEFVISQSTIADNSAAGLGGGIFYQRIPEGVSLSAEESVILNTTITANQGEGGGGIYAVSAFMSLADDTVFDNRVFPEEVVGNNLATAGKPRGKLLLHSTILAEPAGSGLENCAGRIESSGYNLDNPSTPEPARPGLDQCGMGTTRHDLVGVDPLFDPQGLKDNGGPTETLRPLDEGSTPSQQSPVIGAVPLNECGRLLFSEGKPSALEALTVDQRGSQRPSLPDDGCSIGAYEYTPPTVTPTPTTPSQTPGPIATAPPQPAPIATPTPPFLPAAKCASERVFKIHLQHEKRLGVVSATAYVGGRAERLAGKPLSATIDLRGQTKAIVTVKILAITRQGKRLRGIRAYHTCTARLPDHNHLHL